MNKRKHLLTVSLLLTVMVMSTIPVICIGGAEGKQSNPDGGGYRYTDGNKPEPTIKAQYIPVKSNPKAVGLDTPSWSTEVIRVDLGFNFEYYDQTYSRIYVSDNGAMSFVESSATYFDDYWDHVIPSTSSPQGLMAVYWTWDDCYTPTKDRLYVLQTVIDGEKVFIVEWNCNNGGTYEAVLYESGMILFQYQSVQPWYRVGEYCVIGIESPDQTKGTSYTNWKWGLSSDLFALPFAIAFTKETVHISEIKLENGHGREGKTVYAGATDYVFSVDVYHSKTGNDVLSVLLTLGSYGPQEYIRMVYFSKNQTFMQLSGFGFAHIVPASSTTTFHETKYMKVSFAVDFTFDYPSQELRNVSAKATGKAAVPGFLDVSEVYWVETEIEWDGSDLQAWKVTGDQKLLKDGDYVAADQTVKFSGVRILYEGSDVQPRPGLVQFNITDNFGAKQVAYIQPGSTLDVNWDLPVTTTAISWEFEVFGINRQKMLSEGFDFSLSVDADPPLKLKTEDITIRPDDLEDEPSDMDNDQSVWVEWREADDSTSGIGGYIIEATDGTTLVRKSVGPTATSVQIGNDHNKPLPEGTLDIHVIAIDIVGNQARSEPRSVRIDLKGPEFHILNPAPGRWATRSDPEVTLMVVDTITGVEGGSLLYRFSRDAGNNFSPWTTCNAFGKKDKVLNVTVKPSFIEGKDNRVQIKGTDLASSQEVVSEEFPVWVDSKAPYIKMVEPDVDENGTTMEWVTSKNEPLRFVVHDFLGSGIEPASIYYRYSINGGGNYSADIPLEGEGYNNTQGYLEYAFTVRKNWVEGDGNVIIVQARDNVGRSTTKEFRIRVDMAPVFEIESPLEGTTYLDNMTVPFRISVTDIDGLEDITVSWVSSRDGVFGNQLSFSSKMSEGDHHITVIVSDGVHEVKETFLLTVISADSENPENKDSDGDGMNDRFELEHGLDPSKDDSALDLDRDGHTNIEEFYAGTDPQNKSDYPGSEIEEASFPLLALIAALASIVLFLGAGILLLIEARKPSPQQLAPMVQYYNYSQQVSIQPGQPPMSVGPYAPPALPPAPPYAPR